MNSADSGHFSLPTELRIVFLSACGRWADAAIERLTGRAVDWRVVAELATAARATPVVARRLSEVAGGTVPADALEPLRRAGSVEEFRMMLLEERLWTFLAACRERGLRPLLLKGAGIALDRLGGFAQRPMADVDVLFGADELPAAHGIAQALGWVSSGKARAADTYEDLHHLEPLDAPDGLGFGLELHAEVLPSWHPFEFSVASVWADARELNPAAVAGQGNVGVSGVLVPSPAHQLLHTCLHFAWAHCFARGTWRTVRDVEALLSDGQVDPVEFAARAVRARGATCVYWTLAVAEALTGRAPAPELTRALAAYAPRAFRPQLLRYAALEGLYADETPGTRRVREWLWERTIRPGPSGHGRVRPWQERDRWLPRASGSQRAVADPLRERAQGVRAYLRHIIRGTRA